MAEVEKKLSEITRKEWIKFQWLETTTMGEEERTFRRGYRRTPDEAREAMEDWDLTAEGSEEGEEQEHNSGPESDQMS